MKTQVHHIQKQKIVLGFKDEAMASDWNKKGSDYYKKQIMPHLADLFDDLFTVEQRIVVNRIEIDVGTVTEKELKDAILHNMRRKFKTIQAHRQKKSSLKETQQNRREESIISEKQPTELLMDSFNYFIRFGVLLWNSPVHSLKELEIKIMEWSDWVEIGRSTELKNILKSRIARFRLWQQFSPDFTKKALLATIPQTLELKTFSDTLKRTLKSTIKSISILKKLNQQLTNDWMAWICSKTVVFSQELGYHFISWLMPRLAATLKTPTQTLADDLFHKITLIEHSDVDKKLIHSLDKYRSLEIQHREDSSKSKEAFDPDADSEEQGNLEQPDSGKAPEEPVIAGAGTHRDQESMQYYPDSTGKEESGERNQESSKTSDGKADTDSSTRQPGNFIKSQPRADLSEEENDGTSSLEAGPYLPETPGDSILYSEDDWELIKSPDQYPVQDLEFPVSVSDHQVPEEYYLDNAGLVLTWPYLETLFKRLDLLREKSWKTTWHQQKAVLILGYAASGEEVNEEPLLLLPKFLCGWSLHKPVHRGAKFTASELEEVESMLSGLIKNWSILKNTSVEGLRNSFILREGKLQPEDEREWKLIVAQKSFDLLLDHLPYGISVVKLPWIKPLLKVDWV